MPQKKQREAPKVGSVFEKRYKRCRHLLAIVKLGSGIGFKVGDEVFLTPTAAATSITGSEVNGWVWWGIEDR